jgi:hypothetical protein
MLSRYLALPFAERKIVRDVVEALCVAAALNKAKWSLIIVDLAL